MQELINYYSLEKNNSNLSITGLSVLTMINNVKEFNDATQNSMAEETLELDQFYDTAISKIMGVQGSFTPGQMLNLIYLFKDEPKQRKTIVNNILNLMRADKIDVRNFNFG
jgi:hypothetical protein